MLMRCMLLTALAAVAAMCVGCGSTIPAEKPQLEDVSFQPPESTNPPHIYVTERIEPAVPYDPPSNAFTLPAPEDVLRELSVTVEARFQPAPTFIEPANEALLTINGENLTFSPEFDAATPSIDDLAYATYGGLLGDYDGPATIHLAWKTLPQDEGNLYVALADFSDNSWQWFAGSIDSALDVSSFTDYTSPEGAILAVVALTGNTAAELSWLRFGESVVPLVELLADVQSGEAPLLVNFDASGSSDPEGTALNYEWDLDGDGTFEIALSSDATQDYAYDVAGTFSPAVRVSDEDGGQNTASVTVEVEEPGSGNLPPTALLSATPPSGDAPLAVTLDASGSSDSDGTVVQFDWDFDGDGNYDLVDGGSVIVDQLYSDPGTFNVTVRVRDDDAATATAVAPVEVADVNLPPAAEIVSDYYFGDSTLNVTLDASGSSDSDGSIALYEWDLDNNGEFELNTGTTASTPASFAAPGNHSANVRVTDDDGLTSEDTLVLTVDDADNGYDETEANDTFDAADVLPLLQFGGWDGNLGLGGYDGSRDDWYSILATPETKISILMQFIDDEADLDLQLIGSDGSTVLKSSTSTDDDELLEYSINDAGMYFVRCYVWPSAPPEALADYTLNITQEIVTPPTAAFDATPESGPVALTVSFDGSTSSDSDGNITKYEWDLDGNGTYEINTAGVPTVEATFYRAGTYTVILRVTDNDGATDTEQKTITATETALFESEQNDNSTEASLFPPFPFTNLLCDLGPGGYDGDTEDWYELTVAEAGIVAITMNLFDPFGDLDMKLYDSALVEIGSSTGTDNDEFITESVAAGTYYLKCYVYNPGGGGYGGYMLSASFTP